MMHGQKNIKSPNMEIPTEIINFKIMHTAVLEYKVKVKQSRHRPGVAKRVPGLGSHIFITFGTQMW
jgi:hypothetical protein